MEVMREEKWEISSERANINRYRDMRRGGIREEKENIEKKKIGLSFRSEV